MRNREKRRKYTIRANFSRDDFDASI